METPTSSGPDRTPQGDGDGSQELVRDLVDEVQRDLDRADEQDDEARLDALEKTRRDLETELDSSLENGSSRH